MSEETKEIKGLGPAAILSKLKESNSDCPKCGEPREKLEVRWCHYDTSTNKIPKSTPLGPAGDIMMKRHHAQHKKDGLELLHIKCARCGYGWHELPLDSKEEE